MTKVMFIEYGSYVGDSVAKNRVRASVNSRSSNSTTVYWLSSYISSMKMVNGKPVNGSFIKNARDTPADMIQKVRF